MKTTISGSLQDGTNRARWLLLFILATTAIVVDFTILLRGEYVGYSANRVVNVAIVLALFICIAPSPRGDLGIRLVPVQGFRYWLRVGSYLLAAVIAIGVGSIAILKLGYIPQWREVPTVEPNRIVSHLIPVCIEAPLLEELLYRLILCTPIAAVSPVSAIAASGLIFAALHFAYGNPGADNFIAGYLLAWAYLKSGSIVIPIALHAAGNAIALGNQVAYWYVLYG